LALEAKDYAGEATADELAKMDDLYEIYEAN
jgi:hypothetical protein